MEIALSTLLPLLLLLLSSPTAVFSAIAPAGAGEDASGVLLPSPAAAPSPAMAPGADEHTSDCGIYIVFVSRADYVDSADYDARLLASVVGRLVVTSVWPVICDHLINEVFLFCCSTEEAKKAVIYHYSGLGFAARLKPNQADQLSSERC
jgi:hypothetical protein